MMRGLQNAVGAVAAVVALLIVAPTSVQAEVEQKQPAKQVLKRAVNKKLHNLVLQVNVNDPAMMNLALNNATNVAQYYKDLS